MLIITTVLAFTLLIGITSQTFSKGNETNFQHYIRINDGVKPGCANAGRN
jgi:hypothetical protein